MPPPADLIDSANRMRERIVALQAQRGPANWEWYPYDSLANVQHLVTLLGDSTSATLTELSGGLPWLDAGCGDGHMSFWLESLGFTVHAMDNHATHHNTMRGVEWLADRLGSHVEIRRGDVDEGDPLPGTGYGVALCMGLLYHLKNPYLLLERLARASRYVIVSTLIRDRIPGVTTSDLPLAWLLDATELNADDSNYWLFTRAALLRVFARCHLDVRTFVVLGADAQLPGGQRILCILKSCYGAFGAELIDGVYEAEDRGWRWTARTFRVRVDAGGKPARLRCEMFVPEAVARGGPLGVSLRAGDHEARRQVLDREGIAVCEVDVPAGPGECIVTVEFDRAIRDPNGSGRELGVILSRAYLAASGRIA